MTLSDAAKILWAKSDRDKEKGSWHPLIGHLLDVSACAEIILDREPQRTLELYAQDLNTTLSQAKAWVCALAGLHDIGKASPAFQQKWDEGKERGWSNGLVWKTDPTPPPYDISHSVISEAVLPELLEDIGWNPRAAQNISAAVGEHHGYRAIQENLDSVVGKEKGKGIWNDVRRELFEAVLWVLKPGEAPQVPLYGGAAFERLAGLTSFADWVGSSFDFSSVPDDLASYYESAKAQAVAKLDSVGWFRREVLLPERQRLEEVFAYLGKPDQPFQARPLQSAIEQLLDGIENTPALLLVEAPMGEGKTEAALYAHLRLQATNSHRGMYIALPTQATGNLMFERTKEFLGRYGKSRRLDLQLLHGASELVEAYQKILVQSNTTESKEGVEAQIWFSHRKRGLLSEYAVGTVDQALLSILPTKHHFIRLWGLGNRVVVLDEVHAYDTYTNGLIESLVRWLRAMDSSVVLMSATLPKAKRENLLKAYGAQSIPEDEYPRITRVLKNDPTPTSFSFAARPQPTITLQAMPWGIESLAEKALSKAQSGGCIACIVNTVQRAQDLYRALAKNHDEVEVCLFHARYPLEERLYRERLVKVKFGKKSSLGRRRPHKAILVATQVVEQSLDLDFDAMLTDLAPLDLVLQRAGRLHRHPRNPQERHDHTQPELWVAGLAAEGVPEFGSAERIYERYILLRSWLSLNERQKIELPADIDRLVQEVYSEIWPKALSPEWTKALKEAQTRMDKRDSRDQDEAFYAAFGEPDETDWLEAPDPRKLPDDEPNPDDDPSLLKTRKGSPSATVVFAHKIGGKLYLDKADQQPMSLAKKLELPEAKRLFARSVKLSRHELTEQDFSALKAHRKSQGLAAKVWSETPLLAHAHPVVLEAGHALIGELELELHPQLGVVYRSAL